MNKTVTWILLAVLAIGAFTGVFLLYKGLSSSFENGDALVEDMPQENKTDAPSSAPSEAPKESEKPKLTPEVSPKPDEKPQPTHKEPTNPAPDFVMLDENGKQIKLSDLRGKPVVLNFWTTWCGYCKGEMPYFHNANKRYGKDVQFVMLNCEGYGAKSQVENYFKHERYSFTPYYVDKTGDATRKYNIDGYPETYFIDADGNLVAHAEGSINMKTLQEGINKIRK